MNAYLMLGSLVGTSTRDCNEMNALSFCAFRGTPEIEIKYRVLVSRYRNMVRNSTHAYGAMTIASNAMRVYNPYLICRTVSDVV